MHVHCVCMFVLHWHAGQFMHHSVHRCNERSSHE